MSGPGEPAAGKDTTQPDQDGPKSPDTPILRIIKGNPTPEEVAAVTVVLTAIAGGAAGTGEPEQVRLAGSWADPSLRLRRPIHPAPGAWRASVRY